jgi:hypothetical protein
MQTKISYLTSKRCSIEKKQEKISWNNKVFISRTTKNRYYPENKE